MGIRTPPKETSTSFHPRLPVTPVIFSIPISPTSLVHQNLATRPSHIPGHLCGSCAIRPPLSLRPPVKSNGCHPCMNIDLPIALYPTSSHSRLEPRLSQAHLCSSVTDRCERHKLIASSANSPSSFQVAIEARGGLRGFKFAPPLFLASLLSLAV